MPKTGKLVILTLDGDFEGQGFRVTLEIASEGQPPHTEITGFLPPAPDLVEYLEQWQQQYRSLDVFARIKPQEIIFTGALNWVEGCHHFAQKLASRLKDWLDSESFRQLDKRLREDLNRDESIRVLIRSQNRKIHQLPWSVWEFIERYPKAEIALSTPSFELVSLLKRADQQKVKILAIVGHSDGIDTIADLEMLQALPDTEVKFLVEPPRQQVNDQLWEQSWDILFFAGHSKTEGESGRIYLNPQESLTIEQLKYGLKKAIAGGLQLAIFNSCDGLGLAYELEQLNLPQIIVMREAIPDRIAQEFLKYFLKSFANGTSFYESQRQARERLQGWEHTFPSASWLPVIYQNPAAIPPDWQTLRGQPQQQQKPQDSIKPAETEKVSQSIWQRLKLLGLASTIATSVVIGVRSFGLLQSWELKAFDQFMSLRAKEQPDERILVITIDEADIQYQQQMGMKRQGSLSDTALSGLLKKIAPYQPKAIGLDIVHDFPFEADLASRLNQTKQFIGICRVSSASSNLISIAGPPKIPIQQLGFSNLALDPDYVIRRQILGMSPDSICQTDYSFSLRIALAYLENPPISLTSDGLKIGDKLFKQLEFNSGAYQLPPTETTGYQILLNYRSSPPRQIPLREILNGTRDAQLPLLVKERIILIGVKGENQDAHYTPYSQGKKDQTMPGVVLHAQMISQIISAVLDGRQLFWWWPQWLEILWVGIWSVVGGLLGRIKRPVKQGLVFLGSLTSLLGLCLVVFFYGGWLPFIPSVLVLVMTGAIMKISIKTSKNS